MRELTYNLYFEQPRRYNPDIECGIILFASSKELLIDPLQLHRTIVLKTDFESITITDTYKHSYTINVTHDVSCIYWTVWICGRKTPVVYRCLRELYLKECIKKMCLLHNCITDKKKTAYPKHQLTEFKRKLWNKKFVAYGLNTSTPDAKTNFAYGVFDFQFKARYRDDSDIWYHIKIGPLEYCSAIAQYSTFTSLRNQLEYAVYNRGELCHLRLIYEYLGESTYIDYKDEFVYITHCELYECNDIIAYIGSSYDIIKSIYCKLLFYALYRWAHYCDNDRPNGEVLYNQIKSTVVERGLQGVPFDEMDISLGHTDRISHVLVMQAGNNGLVDEFGSYYAIENDTICLDRLLRRPFTVKVNDLSLWLNNYNTEDLFHLRVWWLSKGEKLMKKIKNQLPADIDLWFAPAEGSEWPFFSSANLYMTKQKSCSMTQKQDDLYSIEGMDILNDNEQRSALRYIGQHNHSCTKIYRKHPTFELAFDKSTPITKVSICCKNCNACEDITDYASWSV